MDDSVQKHLPGTSTAHPYPVLITAWLSAPAAMSGSPAPISSRMDGCSTPADRDGRAERPEAHRQKQQPGLGRRGEEFRWPGGI